MLRVDVLAVQVVDKGVGGPPMVVVWILDMVKCR